MPRLEGGVKVYQDMQIGKIRPGRTVYSMYLENDLSTLTIENNSLEKEELLFAEAFQTLCCDYKSLVR